MLWLCFISNRMKTCPSKPLGFRRDRINHRFFGWVILSLSMGIFLYRSSYGYCVVMSRIRHESFLSAVANYLWGINDIKPRTICCSEIVLCISFLCPSPGVLSTVIVCVVLNFFVVFVAISVNVGLTDVIKYSKVLKGAALAWLLGSCYLTLSQSLLLNHNDTPLL